MGRTANDKRGEAAIVIGEQAYVLRLSFRAMKELKEHFGMSVQKYLGQMPEDDVDLEGLTKILEVGLRHGGNPLSEDELLDQLDVAHAYDYVLAMRKALGGKEEKQPDGEDPTTSTTTS
jgi:hypothetical protein